MMPRRVRIGLYRGVISGRGKSKLGGRAAIVHQLGRVFAVQLVGVETGRILESLQGVELNDAPWVGG